MLTVEQFAGHVAGKIAGPPEAAGEGEAALDLAALIELIASILMQVMDNCPANDAAVVKAIKAPGFLQKARFSALVSRECNQCFRAKWRDHAGSVAGEMLKAAAALPDAEALAIVYEARNPDWMLV